MRLSVVLLVVALAGVLGGGALISIGLAPLGGVVIFDFLLLAGWALFRDDGTGPVPRPQAHGAPTLAHGAPTLAQVLERARAS